jgi:hypothetical protein
LGGGGISVIVACSGSVSGVAGISVGQNEKARCNAIDATSATTRPRRGGFGARTEVLACAACADGGSMQTVFKEDVGGFGRR